MVDLIVNSASGYLEYGVGVLCCKALMYSSSFRNDLGLFTANFQSDLEVLLIRARCRRVLEISLIIRLLSFEPLDSEEETMFQMRATGISKKSLGLPHIGVGSLQLL